MTSNLLLTPSTHADWYAANYPRLNPEQEGFEHGGPETQKGGAHAPVSVRNTTGSGMGTALGCMCGHRPGNWPESPRSTDAAYRAHVRAQGLPRIRNFSHAVYAFGEGYPAEGLTFNEWNAVYPNLNPYGDRN